MRYRTLGSSDVKVSEISLGCWTLGGLNWVDGFPNGWANVDEDECISAINNAIEAGVNHFDNADCYGNGRAERLLAKAIGPKRKDIVISTKVGHFRGTAENAYEGLHVRHQCEQSLKNLATDYIDIYYFHHGDFGPEDRYLDEAIEAVTRLKEEGKIRLIGLSAYSAADFERLVPKVKPTVLQSWANLLDDQFIRKDSPVANLLAQHKMSFVAFSPLGQGILLGKYDPENPPKFEEGDYRRGKESFSADGLRKTNAKVELIKERFGQTVPELAGVALQYVLEHDNVACVIPGFRNNRQVQCNVAAGNTKLTPQDVEYLRGIFAQ